MPSKPFFLFGMGNRQKFIYRDGQLIDPGTAKVQMRWNIRKEFILPSEYKVLLTTGEGKVVSIQEDESGIWIENGSSRSLVAGTSARLVLPMFEEFRYDKVLRVLHNEILINILDGRPLPNFLVYSTPWRRDAAMMAMCLQKTGNLDLIKDWVLNIDSAYDHNNKANGVPESEADNLGQTLYLISLFSDANHRAVREVLAEVPRFLVVEGPQRYIRGRSDFHYTPLYQTKWLKFGLRSLGLEDPYTLPHLADDYSSLFWWDYKQARAGDEPPAHDYPYLGWARDHFHSKKRNPVSDRDYPLTWELNASQANYKQMASIDEDFVRQKNSMPHSWHAAEVFLYLLDFKKD